MIHNSSVISKKAKVSNKTKIGPFCYVGPDVELADNVELVSNVHVEGKTTRRIDEYPWYPWGSLLDGWTDGRIGRVIGIIGVYNRGVSCHYLEIPHQSQ